MQIGEKISSRSKPAYFVANQTANAASNAVRVELAPFALHRYNKEDFDLQSDAKSLQFCREVKTFGPPFHWICLYPKTEDVYVSGAFWAGGSWESGTTKFILKLLNSYRRVRPVYVDLGANIGSHAVPVAKRGFRVWAVEPLTPNLIRLYKAANLSGSLDNLHLFQNTLDSERGETIMNIDAGNKGGSQVIFNNSDKAVHRRTEVNRAVTLTDLFNDIKLHEAAPLTVVMKVDIQFHECRVFIPSKELFEERSELFAAFVLMEWVFMNAVRRNVYSESCPRQMVGQLADMFVQTGYKPYTLRGQPLDAARSPNWLYDIVLWVHATALNPFERA